MIKQTALFLARLNSSSETVKGYKIDPENCLAALSIVKDSPGLQKFYLLALDVEMNIFNSLTDYPDFSLIDSQKMTDVRLTDCYFWIFGNTFLPIDMTT